MTLKPLDTPCLHVATPQEQQRDPDYRTCNAQAGEPCSWAKRHDGLTNPAFHSERLECAVEDQATLAPNRDDLQDRLDTETFREAVLDTGLI